AVWCSHGSRQSSSVKSPDCKFLTPSGAISKSIQIHLTRIHADFYRFHLIRIHPYYPRELKLVTKIRLRRVGMLLHAQAGDSLLAELLGVLSDISHAEYPALRPALESVRSLAFFM